ncbi:hypothetical protein Ddye_020157 [Dipteronia dyeriana]|uniref:PGG domain-containing protein n=1 Tax=Dipteronia dyeriana TaxID=168575 RepID=A0AAD9TZF1_9ROSI|nr:hypothetical protein Ddye_020157 [Dipteronia dyeriana]
MERRIYEAAIEGSVIYLFNLLQEDALILDRLMVGCYAETPLHIASMLGHLDFVQELLIRKPELAGELDYRKSSPLHLAAAKGHVDIVKSLITVNPETCFVRDRDGRSPLHIAAIKGNVCVLKELLRVRPDTARILTDRGGTVLHLCVRYNQLEALKFLVETLDDPDFFSCKDHDGNTILHMAVADKQVEAIKFLTTSTRIEVNALNGYGLTALDFNLTQSYRDFKDWEIKELLIGGIKATSNAKDIKCNWTVELVGSDLTSHKNKTIRQHLRGNNLENVRDKEDDWLEKKRSVLMVVASLIATVAFQAALNPPGGVHQETGYSVLYDSHRVTYILFLAYNTTGFVSSLSIILLLISGLPIRHKCFVWILMVVMWVAVTAMAFTYMCSITVLTDSREANLVGLVVMLVWLVLMGILLLVHAIRLGKLFMERRTKARIMST